MNLSIPFRFSLLGCPVGPPDFCEATFQTRVDKIKLSLGLLHTLEDSQAQTTLLRSCLALPKVVSVLRAGSTAHDFDCSRLLRVDLAEGIPPL